MGQRTLARPNSSFYRRLGEDWEQDYPFIWPFIALLTFLRRMPLLCSRFIGDNCIYCATERGARVTPTEVDRDPIIGSPRIALAWEQSTAPVNGFPIARRPYLSLNKTAINPRTTTNQCLLCFFSPIHSLSDNDRVHLHCHCHCHYPTDHHADFYECRATP